MKKKTKWITIIIIVLIILIGGLWLLNSHQNAKKSDQHTRPHQHTYVVKAASPLELSGTVTYQQKYDLIKVQSWQLLVQNGASVWKGEKLDTTGQLAPANGIFELGNNQNSIYTTPFKAQGTISEYDLDKLNVGDQVNIKSLTQQKQASQTAQITYLQLNADKNSSGVSYYNFETTLPPVYRLGQHVIISVPSKYSQIAKKAVHNHQVKLKDGTKKALTADQIKQSDNQYDYVDQSYLAPQTKLVYKDK
ncbi:hypothetical protein MOO45_07745 [Bombilactobacillus folatiphilus]|uniref:SAF domain-containing protein n=1 Tax=Bombilactobacillus folatiphilus TaxID=2923362 RepID=A0ABY4P8M0_9LACO|nr:hypothetical protein [Bombilactobacillus folatiphilus]UQS82068.1 hypothetical protein MOO45_07745 [Bombilactobacillus folatiphilus]